jgi:hypothetical protein
MIRFYVRNMPAAVVHSLVANAATTHPVPEKARRARILLDHFDGQAFVFQLPEGIGFGNELNDILHQARRSSCATLPPPGWDEAWNNFQVVTER